MEFTIPLGHQGSASRAFFEEREYFTVVDAGYNTSFEFGKGNIHAMYWHTDRRKVAGIPQAQGITIAGEQQIGSLLPFLRYAYQVGQAAVLKHFIYGGVGLKDVFDRADDLIGIGFGWGEPANKSLFVTDQKSLEAFYRVHLTKEFSATAGITYIKDPPLNLTEDEVTVFSIRGRIDLQFGYEPIHAHFSRQFSVAPRNVFAQPSATK